MTWFPDHDQGLHMVSRATERPIIMRREASDARMTIWSAIYSAGCENGLGTIVQSGWYMTPLEAAAAVLERAIGPCQCKKCLPLFDVIADGGVCLRLVGDEGGPVLNLHTIDTPRRIQLRRAKGWTMPPNTVKVDRSTKWGNPHRLGLCPTCGIDHASVEEVVAEFSSEIDDKTLVIDDDGDPITLKRLVIQRLRGKNLACWCRLCEKHKDGKPLGVKCEQCSPCHADVLLEVANRNGDGK